MSEISEIKPFKQVPSCDADTELVILGGEVEVLQNFLNIFKTPLAVIENIFNRNLNNGKIQIKYIQEDGTEIPKEDALKYIEFAREYLKSRENQKSEEKEA